MNKSQNDSFESREFTGFSSPGQDYRKKRLDLNDLIISHPESTFFLRVEGDGRSEVGIHSGDILVVDRALEPVNGSLIVAVVEGELVLRRLYIQGGRLWLLTELDSSEAREITRETDWAIWGVVTYVVHPV